MDITTTVYRDDQEITLTITGEYVPAVEDEPWGYFGATGGTAEDVYIECILVGSTPWTGTLTAEEEESVLDELLSKARNEIVVAQENAAADAYEAFI